MNNEHDLDHLIDAAARQMAQCEPSDALSEAVMERICARATPFALPRVAWGGLAAAAVIGALVIGVGVNRPAAPPSAADSGLKAQGAGLTPQASGLKAQGHAEAQSAEAGAQAEGSGLRAQGSGTGKRVIVSIAVEETEPVSDSIAVDIIAAAPLEVDRLEVTTLASIDPIEIAPLEIEPLSAAND